MVSLFILAPLLDVNKNKSRQGRGINQSAVTGQNQRSINHLIVNSLNLVSDSHSTDGNG